MQATIRAFAGYGYSQSERLIARELYPFHSRTVSIGAGGTVTPLPWFNIVLGSGYAWNVSETDGGRQDMAQTVRTATQRLSLNFYVTRQITLTASAEDNYNNLTAKDRHAWFGDLSAKYKLQACRPGTAGQQPFQPKAIHPRELQRAGHPYSDLATQAYEHRRNHKVQFVIMWNLVINNLAIEKKQEPLLASAKNL